MIDHARAVDRIEQAQARQPYCPCGQHTTTIWRDDAVWLECASLASRPAGSLRDYAAALLAPAHVRARIAEIPAGPAQRQARTLSG